MSLTAQGETMSGVDRLNIYPPYTLGWVLVGTRYTREWVQGIILGRVNGHRRVAIRGDYVFVEHMEQFHLKRPWYGVKNYGLLKI